MNLKLMTHFVLVGKVKLQGETGPEYVLTHLGQQPPSAA